MLYGFASERQWKCHGNTKEILGPLREDPPAAPGIHLDTGIPLNSESPRSSYEILEFLEGGGGEVREGEHGASLWSSPRCDSQEFLGSPMTSKDLLGPPRTS